MTHNQQRASDESGEKAADEGLRSVREVLKDTATQDNSVLGDDLPEAADPADLEREDEWRPSDATEES